MAVPAFAQSEVTVSSLTRSNDLMNAAQRAEENRDPYEYVLSWQYSGGGSLSYRYSFDRWDISGSPSAQVPRIGGDAASGSGVTSASITVSEEALIERINTSTTTYPPIGGTLTVYILVYQTDEDPNEESEVYRGSWIFNYDFVGPAAPVLQEVTPGERAVEVRWSFPSGYNADDIEYFQVDYCPGVSEEVVNQLYLSDIGSGVTLNSRFPAYVVSGFCENPRTATNINQDNEDYTMSEGLEEETWVLFSLASKDGEPYLNVTPVEDRTYYAVRTELFFDFFERQEMLGGGEDGGFCFIATAAWGSYAHPVVWILRQFRDYVLAPLPYGDWLIEQYYTHSPPLAQAIDRSPALAQTVRVLLVMLVLGMGLMAFGVLRASWRLVRRGASWLGARRTAATVLVLGACMLSATAEAQVRRGSNLDVGVGFEVKAGPYLPAMGESVDDGGSQAWNEVYGFQKNHVLVALGGELQLLRSVFGTLGVTGSAGFANWQGNAQRVDGDGVATDGPRGTSTLNVIPLTLGLVYRLDTLLDLTDVPLAPYVKGGLAYNVWWNNRDDGGLSQSANDNGEGLGGKPGLFGAVGIALALNFIDEQSAAQFQASSGVRTTYLFFEGQTSWIDGFGATGFDFSETTWAGGLMLEL